VKQGCLNIGKSAGLFRLASSSHFRNTRVLVLGYHGISLQDEHCWDPSLYLSADNFRRRMDTLKRNQCAVLSLEEALRLVKADNLPERAVVLTFDDGTYDFYKIVWPILKEFGYPATLYLTTYYVDHQYPITPGIWRYMLWKAKGLQVNAAEVLGKPATFNLAHEAGRIEALRQIKALAESETMDGHQMNALSANLARALGLDFDSLCDSRIVQLLRPEEVRALARDGVSVQMHMHRHVSPPVREAYVENLQMNRERISRMTGSEPSHFCYPSGYHAGECVNWVRDCGVESATTCDLGLLSGETERLLIPRLIDSSALPDVAFESWLVGIGALVSRVGALVARA
jgi:peptidoglycan/xylan/chitin deacetylase (PgdA/CDA1 family)